MLPVLEEATSDKPICEMQFTRNYQNLHPLLAWYKSNLTTSHFSYEKFLELTDAGGGEAI